MLVNSCPACGSTEFAARAYETAPAGGADRSGWPELACAGCSTFFFSDTEKQTAFDEETRREHSRMEAMKRGEYMIFNPRSQSTADIAKAVWAMIEKKRKADKS